MKLSNIIKRDWPLLLMLCVPFVLMAYYWNQIPDQVPVHWNVYGEIDGWSNKEFGILSLAFLNPGLYLLLLFLPLLDPKKNIQYFIGTLQKLKFILHGFILLLFVFILYSSMNPEAPSEKVVPLMCLVLIMVLGNYLGKMKPNYFIGVRTPWTLQSDEIWLKTHLLTGRLWTGASVLMLVMWLVLPAKAFAVMMIPYVIVIALVPILYSFILFRRNHKVN